MAPSVADEEPDREGLTSSIVSVGVGVEPVVDGTTSSVVTVLEPLEDGMGALVEAVDWNVEITFSGNVSKMSSIFSECVFDRQGAKNKLAQFFETRCS